MTAFTSSNTETQSPLNKAVPHESAVRQVAGSARYTDDIPVPSNTAYAAVGVSNESAGQIKRIDLDAVRQAPGVIDVITVADIPGKTDIAPVFEGDPILADQNIFECPVTIIDPQYDDNDSRLVTTIFDPYEAADFLTWKRNKK